MEEFYLCIARPTTGARDKVARVVVGRGLTAGAESEFLDNRA
jgi:hypothetical protein